MEDFFSEQSYYEFPSIEAAIYALLLSFLLSTIIALTYRYTFRGIDYSKDLFQAIVLISIIAATIMMAIGDSLARGLGILGALAIIRFRYRFDNNKVILGTLTNSRIKRTEVLIEPFSKPQLRTV